MSRRNEQLKGWTITNRPPRKDKRTSAAKQAERERLKRRSRLDDMIFEKELGIFGQLD